MFRSALVFLALVVVGLNAQTITGSISGVVADPTGWAIPGATVRLTETGTGLTRQASTVTGGDFSFPVVPPGAYSRTVEAAGHSRARAGNGCGTVTACPFPGATSSLYGHKRRSPQMGHKRRSPQMGHKRRSPQMGHKRRSPRINIHRRRNRTLRLTGFGA